MRILDELYRGRFWPMLPDEEEARERFRRIRQVMGSLLDEGLIPGGRILDVMAGSGIAGAALASEMAARGRRGSLTVVDARAEDLGHARRWLEIGGARDFPLRKVVCDATRLPERLKGPFDVAIVWGSPLPHLSPWGFALLLAGVSDLCDRECTLLVQQTDLVPRILIRNDYRHVLAEGDMVHIHAGYDARRGMMKRLYYRKEDMRLVGEGEYRIWDVASAAAMIWLFFSEVQFRKVTEMDRVLDLIVARGPRKALPWSELFENTPVEP